MIIINIAEARRIIAEAESKPKPYRNIVVVSRQSTVDAPQSKVDSPREIIHRTRLIVDSGQSTLSEQCWAEFKDLKNEQGKVANEIHELKDGSDDERKDLYERVESFRPDLVRLYKVAKHVDQYGTLPEEVASANPVDIYSLKDQKRRLIDQRSKLLAKIKKGEATNSPKLNEWRTALEISNAEFYSVDDRLKKLHF